MILVQQHHEGEKNLAERDPIPEESKHPTRVIKRYSNRKLYDTDESRYVTLVEIAQMVRAGEEVQIIDNRTKEDLTSVTLAQIVFEEEKKASTTPLFVLRDMVRHGGDKLFSFITDEVNPRVLAIRTEAEQAVAKVFRKEVEGVRHAREFVKASRQTLEDWNRTLEERLHRTMKSVVGLPSLHREVQALRDKLSELERKLEEHGE